MIKTPLLNRQPCIYAAFALHATIWVDKAIMVYQGLKIKQGRGGVYIPYDTDRQRICHGVVGCLTPVRALSPVQRRMYGRRIEKENS